jgi:hypothetical protein
MLVMSNYSFRSRQFFYMTRTVPAALAISNQDLPKGRTADVEATTPRGALHSS